MRVIVFYLSVSLLVSAIIMGLCLIPSQFWWAEMIGGLVLLIPVCLSLHHLEESGEEGEG